MHSWDGATLVVGRIPDVGTKDQPDLALKGFEADWARDVHSFASSSSRVQPNDYPLAWALVTFLREHDGAKYKRWSQELDNGGEPTAAWQATFAGEGPSLNEAFLRWLEKHQRPWHTPYGAWQRVGDVIEGKAEQGSYGIACLKQPADLIDVSVKLRDPEARAGLVLDYKTDVDFALLLVDQYGKGILREVREGDVRERPIGPAPRKDVQLEFRISAVASKGEWVVRLDDKEFARLPRSEGRLGIVAENGIAHFRVRTE